MSEWQGEGVLKTQGVSLGVNTDPAVIYAKIQQRPWSPEFLGICTLCQGCTLTFQGFCHHICVAISMPCLLALLRSPKPPLAQLDQPADDMASYALNLVVPLGGPIPSFYPGPRLCPASHSLDPSARCPTADPVENRAR